MTILDLQGMETSYRRPPKGSRASKHCGASGLSLLLC
ncbi:SapB/AmfS family lanthipeptide [Streptomyces sp. CB03234]|nr:SapB/AmfS family lanthipeptide [Streptomyces sp. CB03234]